MKESGPRKPNTSYKYQIPSYQLPKRTWVQRNPRLFGILFITGSLSVFFSRQIYDIFIRDPNDFVDANTLRYIHKR